MPSGPIGETIAIAVSVRLALEGPTLAIVVTRFSQSVTSSLRPTDAVLLSRSTTEIISTAL